MHFTRENHCFIRYAAICQIIMKEIGNNFLFRLLKALGKYINTSGLDQAFAEPETCTPGTIDQINNGT